MSAPVSPFLRAALRRRLVTLLGVGFGLVVVALVNSCGSPLQSGGRLHFDARRYDRAVEVFEAEVLRNPNDAQAHFWLGRSYAELDSVDRALSAFDRAVALDPGLAGDVTRHQGALAMRAAAKGRGFLAEALALEATSPQRPERLGRAAAALGLAERLAPDDGPLQVDLYRVSRARGDSMAAAEHLSRATRLADSGALPAGAAAGLYRERGQDAVLRKDYREAIAMFDTAARLTPENADLLMDLAAAHLLEAETSGAGAREPGAAYRDATRILETVRRLRPDDPDALYNLATIRFRIAEYAAADTLLRGYLRRRPEDPDGWQLLEQVLQRLNRSGAALTAGVAGDLLTAASPAARPAEWAQTEVQRNGGSSDLGRLYAELGPPDRADYRQSRGGRITQVWFYFKAGRVVAFKDGAISGEPIHLER